MFKKPFKQKFQNQLKTSEKKKFFSDLKAHFPALRDDDISGLFGKEMILRTKVITSNEEDVDIYCINKVPFYFDVIEANIKLPTVFLVWKFPHMLPCVTTISPVLSKLKNGADLFLPGVYQKGLHFSDLDFRKNDPVYVNLMENKTAVAVGLSLVNKDDILCGNKNLGGVVRTYHTTGDFLFKMHSEAVIPELGPPDWALIVNEDLKAETDLGTIENSENTADSVVELSEGINNVTLETKETDTPTTADNLDLEKEKNNELLEYCFLKALKSIPKTAYPILPATFYANHVLTNLPEGENLNIKKTKWKKFSSFLQEKSTEGLIHLEKAGKGEFSIARANLEHKQLKEFVDPHKVVVVEPKPSNTPSVTQVYFVSAATQPFFSKFGLKRDDELTRDTIRNYLNDYIKSENLVHPEQPEFVILDPILSDVLGPMLVISRANLLGEILEKMRTKYKVSTCDSVYKSKLHQIEFEIGLRTGNKKVTLISNLECYGVDVRNFSRELQQKAAASATITPSVPGKTGPQLQVQGNQIAIAVAILKEKYNINEKLMKGLEKAVKQKNKK